MPGASQSPTLHKRVLASRSPVSPSARRPSAQVLLKVAVSYACWAPVCNSAYLTAMPLLRGESLAAAVDAARRSLGRLRLLEAACSAPYNLFAFRLLPLPLRAPVQSLIALFFSVGLALLTDDEPTPYQEGIGG